MRRHAHKRHHWLFAGDPHYYHWDTLFVKRKVMWRGAGTKPDALRQIKHVRKGDRVLYVKYASMDACYIETPTGYQRWDEYKLRVAASERLMRLK